ncbi:hypothetical protein SKAU_G00250660 [Synaphobranchus kaupii]|uniref:Uncharacterized protein n=1 Tax=Synaphobranchus kaupii TaxID=118154 RepID=A0A9Q1F2X2_SYNKA|nr:hypothetical protein SKAU_G00250660 [Synaphobranchus kaupii]
MSYILFAVSAARRADLHPARRRRGDQLEQTLSPRSVESREEEHLTRTQSQQKTSASPWRLKLGSSRVLADDPTSTSSQDMGSVTAAKLQHGIGGAF